MNSHTKSSAMRNVLALLSISLGMSAAAYAQDTRIGFVSTERIFREAAPAKVAEAKIEQEFSKRSKELQDLAAKFKGISDRFDKEAAVMSETERLKRQRDLAEMDKEFQRKQREFREDLNQRKNEELGQVLERTNKVIKQIAEAEKYDIVFQEAVYISPRIDITDKVLRALNK